MQRRARAPCLRYAKKATVVRFGIVDCLDGLIIVADSFRQLLFGHHLAIGNCNTVEMNYLDESQSDDDPSDEPLSFYDVTRDEHSGVKKNKNRGRALNGGI